MYVYVYIFICTDIYIYMKRNVQHRRLSLTRLRSNTSRAPRAATSRALHTPHHLTPPPSSLAGMKWQAPTCMAHGTIHHLARGCVFI